MFALFFALFALLAGRVLADTVTGPFNVTVNSVNITAADTLAFAPSPLLSSCTANITLAQNLIAACAPTDYKCFCNPDTASALFSAELCMLHTLIAQNKPAPDPRAGSNVVIGAYASACAFIGTANNLSIAFPPGLSALTLPPTWDGPFTAVLPVPVAAVFVGVAGVFGVSALFILSNIE